MNRREIAEIVGLQALGWLAGNDELLPVFLGASGASLEDLRGAAGDPAILGSVLDFILMDDDRVMAFCAEAGLAPDAPMAARAALPGGAQRHWT